MTCYLISGRWNYQDVKIIESCTFGSGGFLLYSWFETVKCTMQNCTFQIFLYSYDPFLFLVQKFLLAPLKRHKYKPYKNSTYLRTQNRKMTHKITPCFCLSQLLSKGRNLGWGPPNENGGHRFIFPSKTIFSDLYTFFGYLLPQVHKKWVRLWGQNNRDLPLELNAGLILQ